MHHEDVVPAHLVADLADGLQERQRLDVADGAADLGDDDVHRVGRHAADAVLDLVGDVRDDLHGVAQVLAAALLGDHRRVHLAGGDVGRAVQVAVEEALVVADVQVGLGAVVGDEHLTVLEGVHRARVDVQVGVELLHHDAQATGLEQHAQAGGGEALAERGGDTPGDEDVLGRRRFRRHGQEGAPVVAGCRAVRLSAPDRSEGAVAAVRGFRPTGPRATRVSAPGGNGFRPRSVHGCVDFRPPCAYGRARGGTGTGAAQDPSASCVPGVSTVPSAPHDHHQGLTRSAHTGCPERHADHPGASYPARTFTAGPGRTTAHPSPNHPEQRERGSSLSKDCRFASGSAGCFASPLNDAQQRPLDRTSDSPLARG